MMRVHFSTIAVTLSLLLSHASAQQIAVSRIEQMPNTPAPYAMKNWREVALAYDSLVFNTGLAGQYFPLTGVYTNSVNYPGQNSFRMQSYVGGPLGTGEAINCIPAVVGASLVGVEKSNQNGVNWVLMCQEWFNKSNKQNVYLNSPSSQTGNDWWYETMPNIFFYQLYSLYPTTGDFPNQFVTVPDRWLAALKAMGGSTAPWSLANVNHRAFNLATMTPNNSGEPEPEAAGAIAWILYAAYVRTGDPQYRIGAELALESLLVYTTNPSYELQLPYGTYVAARMNAELGTTYDLTKMINWCFSDGNGTIRQWGTVLGTWGGFDCSGLIGEVNYSNDYAFFMNVVEQVGALVPLVRYDDRYARAIGKWVLNGANAARLFYVNALPDDHQDSEEWAHQYDPQSTIAHEALRQYNPSNANISPYATGDAIQGGWAATNLALYGSSHVGILGGIIDTTNVPMILKLDLLKTDYFHTQAYPSFLFYNPYNAAKSVEINVGIGNHDLYDAVTNAFLQTGVSGVTTFTVPADAAVLAVITPAGGTLSYDFDRTLVNGRVIDYRSGKSVENYPPRIKSLSADTTTVITGKSVRIYCTASDRDNDTLSYAWNASTGSVNGSGTSVSWAAPDSAGNFVISCLVSDGHGGNASDTVTLHVVRSINRPPVILKLVAHPRKIDLRATSTVGCAASDADGDTLSYIWTSAFGVLTGVGPTVTWSAPAGEGNYYLRCVVDDGHGGRATDSLGLVVRDFSKPQTGHLIAYYPFNGNTNDESGFNNNGTGYGVTPAADRLGNANRAFAFNGIDNYIRVSNQAALNFQNSITVNFWMNANALFDRESYPLSHGNWQNRWKVSITPGKRLRWTVKTDSPINSGIKDLDSETSVVADSFYNITALYSGSDVEIYVNGELDAFSSWSGLILATSIDLTIGQVLPTDNNYNFKGVLDEIRLYDYALSVAEIRNLSGSGTSIKAPHQIPLSTEYVLHQNYPNPFNPSTVIRFSVPGVAGQRIVSLRVYDVLGREVATLVNGEMKPGDYSVPWDASNASSGIYYCRLQTSQGPQVRKMVVIR